MIVKNLGKRVLVWALGGSLVAFLALFSGGFLGVGPTTTSVAFANTERVSDESGSLIGVDNEGKLTQAFPLKHTDVVIQVSGPLARAQVTQQFETLIPKKLKLSIPFHFHRMPRLMI